MKKKSRRPKGAPSRRDRKRMARDLPAKAGGDVRGGGGQKLTFGASLPRPIAVDPSDPSGTR